MKRHPCLVPYSSDHHRILILAQILKKSSPPYKRLPTDIIGKRQYALDKYENLLKPHEAREERLLFPNIRNRTTEIDLLLDHLQEEHLNIDMVFRKMKDSVFGADDMDSLGISIDRHVRTEERDLFELVQKALSPKDLDQLSGKL